VIEPARQKDEIILFNDRNLWFYKPGLRKPVSISARQKLVGQAANGDIASTNYARDYEATSIAEDQLNGEDFWKLELKAVATDVTYDRIRYWISKDKMLASKAEFLTVSGQVFKVAGFLYKNSVTLNGKSFPFVSKMRIQDAHNKLNVTTIDYQEPREETHPPAIFNVNNLIK
jgi:outer membrane lipoprotein-sorting protein